MSPWRKILRVSFWFALVVVLGITHRRAWTRGTESALLDHYARSFPTDLERQVKWIEADAADMADEPAHRRREAAELRDDLASSVQAIEAAGYPSTMTMNSSQVTDLVRQARELETKLRPRASDPTGK